MTDLTNNNSILTIRLYTDDRNYSLQDATKQNTRTAHKEAIAALVDDNHIVKAVIVRIGEDSTEDIQETLYQVDAYQYIVDHTEVLGETKTERFWNPRTALKRYYELQLQGFDVWTNVPGARI